MTSCAFCLSCDSLKQSFILANGADPDKMLHSTAFHLSLYYLPSIHLGVSTIQKIKKEFLTYMDTFIRVLFLAK